MQKILRIDSSPASLASVQGWLDDGWTVVPGSIAKASDMGLYVIVLESNSLAAPGKASLSPDELAQAEVGRILDELASASKISANEFNAFVSSLLKGKQWSTAADLTVEEANRAESNWARRVELRTRFVDEIVTTRMYKTVTDEIVRSMLFSLGINVTDLWAVSAGKWETALAALPEYMKKLDVPMLPAEEEALLAEIAAEPLASDELGLTPAPIEDDGFVDEEE